MIDKGEEERHGKVKAIPRSDLINAILLLIDDLTKAKNELDLLRKQKEWFKGQLPTAKARGLGA